MKALINLAAMGVLCYIVHELGHFITAACFGLHPKFGFESRSVVVRYDAPTEPQNRLICEMGFGASMLAGLLMLWADSGAFYVRMYWCWLTLHFLIYPWSARHKASNDFNGLGSVKNE